MDSNQHCIEAQNQTPRRIPKYLDLAIDWANARLTATTRRSWRTPAVEPRSHDDQSSSFPKQRRAIATFHHLNLLTSSSCEKILSVCLEGTALIGGDAKAQFLRFVSRIHGLWTIRLKIHLTIPACLKTISSVYSAAIAMIRRISSAGEHDSVSEDASPAERSSHVENDLERNTLHTQRSSRNRPCDACRRRKSRCVLNEGAVKCVLCEFHAQNCTFKEKVQPRKRRHTSCEDEVDRWLSAYHSTLVLD